MGKGIEPESVDEEAMIQHYLALLETVRSEVANTDPTKKMGYYPEQSIDILKYSIEKGWLFFNKNGQVHESEFLSPEDPADPSMDPLAISRSMARELVDSGLRDFRDYPPEVRVFVLVLAEQYKSEQSQQK